MSLWCLRIFFGGKIFQVRSWSLRGGSFGIGCLQRWICSVGELFIMRRSLVSVGAAYLNHPIIYSCYVIRTFNLGGSPHPIWYFSRLYKGVVFFYVLNLVATSWVIWKEMNDRLFRTKESSCCQILESIRLLSFSWHKTKFGNFYYKFHDWCQNLFLCLGIG